MELLNHKFNFFNDSKAGEMVYFRGFPGLALVAGHLPSQGGPRVLPQTRGGCGRIPSWCHVFSGSLGGDTESQVYGTKSLGVGGRLCVVAGFS